MLKLNVSLRLALPSALEAEAVAAALSVDDEERSGSRVLTRCEGNVVVVEIECSAPAPAQARSLLDDALRAVKCLLPLLRWS